LKNYNMKHLTQLANTYKSIFINDNDNKFLQKNIKKINIHRKPTELVTQTWGNESITSVIIKK